MIVKKVVCPMLASEMEGGDETAIRQVPAVKPEEGSEAIAIVIRVGLNMLI
jgi:hypothetical protein